MTFDEIYEIARHHTVVGRPRMWGLHSAVFRTLHMNVPGDIVECGSYRGGTAAMMALACDCARHIWLFDSFQGMPPATKDDPPDAMKQTGGCGVNVEEVRAFLNEHKILDNGTIVKGWFKDTFPTHQVKQIAVLHVDCDWHDSVKLSLETFYDLVVPGGTVQIDDYGHWAGCRKATDDFFDARGIKPHLTLLDYTGVQHIKGT